MSSRRPASRRRFLSLVADFAEAEVTAFTCGQQAATQRKTEQARMRCLWELVGQLQVRDVGTLVLKSRQEHNDRKDRREIISAKRAGMAPKSLVYRHVRPREEALLWVADALVGAIGLAAAGAEDQYRDRLPRSWQEMRGLQPP